MIYVRKMVISPLGADESYEADIPAVRQVIAEGGLPFESPVTFFVGENGSGKSTMLEAAAIAAGFNAEGGSRNMSFQTCETHSNLYKNVTLHRGAKRPRDGFFLRAESFYNVASHIDVIDEIPAASRKISESYGGSSLHTRSHGEGFMSLALNRFSGEGLYVLDEPEAALSPKNQIALLGRIDYLVKHSSQFIIATHSPIIMAYPGARIFVFSENGIEETEYTSTEHYFLTRRFINDYENFLKTMLD